MDDVKESFSPIGAFNADNAEHQLKEKLDTFKKGMEELAEAREAHSKMKEEAERQRNTIIVEEED